MAKTVEFHGVVCIICLWGKFCTPELQKHPMIRAVYRFHVYYHLRRVLKRLQTPLPLETDFNATDNLYTESEFLKICEDYRVPNDPMRYRDKIFIGATNVVLIGPLVILVQTQ